MSKPSVDSALELEERLRRIPVEDNSQAVQALRRSTAQALRTVLVEDTAAALKRGVDGLLWKTVFYKRIEVGGAGDDDNEEEISSPGCGVVCVILVRVAICRRRVS